MAITRYSNLRRLEKFRQICRCYSGRGGGQWQCWRSRNPGCCLFESISYFLSYLGTGQELLWFFTSSSPNFPLIFIFNHEYIISSETRATQVRPALAIFKVNQETRFELSYPTPFKLGIDPPKPDSARVYSPRPGLYSLFQVTRELQVSSRTTWYYDQVAYFETWQAWRTGKPFIVEGQNLSIAAVGVIAASRYHAYVSLKGQG